VEEQVGPLEPCQQQQLILLDGWLWLVRKCGCDLSGEYTASSGSSEFLMEGQGHAALER